LVCQGFDDTKEGSRFGSLEIVGEGAWIDKVREASATQHLSLKTCKIPITKVELFYSYKPLYVISNMQNN
jgi:hypothetical protein